MKQTPNINLPILEQGDKYLKETQNEAFSVIDREIAGINSAISVLDNVEGSIVDTKSDVETLKNETNTLKASLNDMESNVIPNIQTSLDSNINEVNVIKDNVPYTDYTRNEQVEYDEKYKHYQGFSNHSKHTYGRYEQATVMSVIGNKDNPIPQVLGTDTKGLATYTNRDSVALYTENTGTIPTLTIATDMVYTDNKATVPNGIDMTIIKPGMVIDVGTTVNGNWCVGIIKEINGRELIMEDGFYQIRNDGQTPTKVTPSNGLQARIQMTNKVWVINSNLFIDSGCPGGANLELGVFANHTNINDVGGIDLVNFRESTHYGIKVRSNRSPGAFNEGIVAHNNTVNYVAKDTNNGNSVAYRTVPPQGISKGLDIYHNGALSHLKVNIKTVTKNYTIADKESYIIANGNNINITLPKASDNRGRIIEIISTGTGNLLTAQAGDGISAMSSQSQQISIGKTEGRTHRVVRFISDGGTIWWQLSALS